jgi:uncharacterized membrane protein YphA (DoxX/SURF4 family)
MDNIIDKSENQTYIYTLLVSMFLLSGISKLFNFNGVVDSLKQKIQYALPDDLYKLAIVIVILLEVIAPILIINYSINGTYKNETYYSVIGLIIFTIVATIIYHFPDFTNYKKSLPFWANVSLLGGLLLLAKTIKYNV